MSIPLAIAVLIVSGGLDWKSLFRWSKTVIILCNCSIWVCITCWHNMLLAAERKSSSLPNNSLAPWWLGVLLLFYLFFLLKFSPATAVMYVLRLGWINRSDVLLHSDTKASFLSSPHFGKFKIYFPTFLTLVYPFWCWIKNLY